jgi:hypothetical protein
LRATLTAATAWALSLSSDSKETVRVSSFANGARVVSQWRYSSL